MTGNPQQFAEVTSRLVASLMISFRSGEMSPELDAAVQAYAAYWRRTDASRESALDFAQRLINRSNLIEAGRGTPEEFANFERISKAVLRSVDACFSEAH